jgi:hypothetical protein
MSVKKNVKSAVKTFSIKTESAELFIEVRITVLEVKTK